MRNWYLRQRLKLIPRQNGMTACSIKLAALHTQPGLSTTLSGLMYTSNASRSALNHKPDTRYGARSHTVTYGDRPSWA